MFYDSNVKQSSKEDVKQITKKPKKRINRWALFGLVALAACLTTVYVSNVVQINSLLKEIREIDNSYNKLRNENELLKSRINKAQSPERIVTLAEGKLGMVRTENPPKILKKILIDNK